MADNGLYDDAADTYDNAAHLYDASPTTSGGDHDGGGPTWMPDEDDIAIAIVLMRSRLRI